MIPNYIPRSLEPILKKAVSQFPAIVLVGPRQSGKTTLLKHLYGDQYPWGGLKGYQQLQSIAEGLHQVAGTTAQNEFIQRLILQVDRTLAHLLQVKVLKELSRVVE
jgi:GTPase SAR1 family protein